MNPLWLEQNKLYSVKLKRSGSAVICRYIGWMKEADYSSKYGHLFVNIATSERYYLGSFRAIQKQVSQAVPELIKVLKE